jgi:hypothetical protein
MPMHAAQSFAPLVVRIRTCPYDPRTVSLWARHCAVSAGALRSRCRAVGVPPKDALTFGRMLRAIRLSHEIGWDIYNTLDVVDHRTLLRLERSLGRAVVSRPMTVDAFVSEQRVINTSPLLKEITLLLLEA